MTTKEKYDKIFTDCFSVDQGKLGDKFVYQSVPAWDSVGHMGMIAAMEETFSITMETDDIVDFSSYNKGMEILTKYGVKVLGGEGKA
jgi:acyl carrier protein